MARRFRLGGEQALQSFKRILKEIILFAKECEGVQDQGHSQTQ